jgi:hypothetical protein
VVAEPERFLTGDLPPQAWLMVKYEIPAGGSEYPWAYVTSWKSPEKVLGSSAGDVLTDPVIRAGQPVAIDAATIVDWAVWIDGQGITKAGKPMRWPSGMARRTIPTESSG